MTVLVISRIKLELRCMSCLSESEVETTASDSNFLARHKKIVSVDLNCAKCRSVEPHSVTGIKVVML